MGDREAPNAGVHLKRRRITRCRIKRRAGHRGEERGGGRGAPNVSPPLNNTQRGRGVMKDYKENTMFHVGNPLICSYETYRRRHFFVYMMQRL